MIATRSSSLWKHTVHWSDICARCDTIEHLQDRQLKPDARASSRPLNGIVADAPVQRSTRGCSCRARSCGCSAEGHRERAATHALLWYPQLTRLSTIQYGCLS